MNTNLVKTTIDVSPDLLYRVKRRALDEKKTLREIVVASLENFLNNPVSYHESVSDTEKRHQALLKLAGAWGEDGKTIAKYAKKMRRNGRFVRF